MGRSITGFDERRARYVFRRSRAIAAALSHLDALTDRLAGAGRSLAVQTATGLASLRLAPPLPCFNRLHPAHLRGNDSPAEFPRCKTQRPTCRLQSKRSASSAGSS
ncbi:MAG: hypothetical protein M5U08_19365 [Burkholderiales bacterium]|nr:hypothetical protein [Burkholderiales bacterium]